MKVILTILSVLIIAISSSGNPISHPKLSLKNSRRVSEKLPSMIIKKNLIVNSKLDPKKDVIKLLIDKLEADKGTGTRVTKIEFQQLFNRLESRNVYKDKLI
jgi:hypothetical protein